MWKKILVAFIALLFSMSSFAGRYEFTGKVQQFIANSADYNNTEDYLGILVMDGFDDAGSCHRPGAIGMPVKNTKQGEAQLSIILAASISGSDIFIRVEDDQKDAANRCYLLQVRVYGQ